ncbi:MAG: transposase [Opitutales bacterium]|nr:transposase [Opitutales bacterium]
MTVPRHNIRLPQFFNPFEKLKTSERNLPHWHQTGALFFVTFRLADSLPREKLEALERERKCWLEQQAHPLSPNAESEYHRRFSDKIDEWLDAGSGDCCLKDLQNAEIVVNALKHFDGERYWLGDWVVMPNHVHVVVAPKEPYTVSQVLHSWKSYTANLINKRQGKIGKLWQDEFYDHLIRNERELWRINEYIRKNPEKAKIKALRGSAGSQPFSAG